MRPRLGPSAGEQTPSGTTRGQQSNRGVILPARTGCSYAVTLSPRRQGRAAVDATTAADITQTPRAHSGGQWAWLRSDVKRPGVSSARQHHVSFDRMTVNGRDYPMRGMATQIFQSGGIREEAGTAGAGAGIGGIVGGILGGVKGAILGAVIGAGGAIAATDGKDVELPAGSVIRVRLDSDINVR